MCKSGRRRETALRGIYGRSLQVSKARIPIHHARDAAIGCLILFQDSVRSHKSNSKLPCFARLLAQAKTSQLTILELGAGCGIVGIGLAQMLPNSTISLTDLHDAQELLQKNMAAARPAKGSTLTRIVLQWGDPVTQEIQNTRPDLVLVSDCTYNADSSSDLVKTLVAIANLSKQVQILVAMKRRHDSEAVFFELMQHSEFLILEACSIQLPHEQSDQDATDPVVEIYIFGNKATARA